MVVYAFEHPAVERAGLDEIEAWRTRQQVLRTRATPDLMQRVVALHQTWPDIPSGALVAMAMAGVDPLSDIAAAVEQRAFERAQGHGFHDPGEVVHAQQIAREQEQRDEPGFFDPITSPIRAGVRGAMLGFGTLYDEASRRATSALVAMQDPNRTYAQAMELSTPSLGALVAGDEFTWSDLGDGFIPGGEVRQRQEELKQRLTLDGHWMSPGRALARTVTEPGTKPFNFLSGALDAASNIVLDPATYALGGASKLRHASRAFATDNALIRGIRNMPDEAFARQWWLGSQSGQALRRSLLDETDAYQVWRRLGGDKGRVDRDTARRIAEARSWDELDDVVLPMLGPQGIAEKPIGSLPSRALGMLVGDELGSIHGMGIHVRRQFDKVRLAQWMPDPTIATSDPDRAMVTIHRFLRGIKATDDESAAIMNRALRAGADVDEPVGWLEVAKDLSELAATKALRDSVSGGRTPVEQAIASSLRKSDRAQEIRRFTRLFGERHDELVNYFTVEAGRPRTNVTTWFDGSEVDLSQIPHLATELLSRNIPLPDMQLLRRHIGGYARTMRVLEDIWEPLGMSRNVVEGVTDLAARFMTSVWKPMVLLRGAYVARVGGEEQLRMAAAGLDSAFRHPLSFILWQAGRRGGTWRGGQLADMADYQAILQRKGGGWIGRKPGSTPTGDWIRFRRGDPGVTDAMFARAWADDLGFLINDEIASIVARMGAREAKDYLASARGRPLLQHLAEAEHMRPVLNSRRALDDYVDSVWLRIEEKTRGNADLIDAIGTGRLDGKVVRWFDRDAGASRPDELARALRARLDEVGITEVKGHRWLDPNRREAVVDQLHAGVDVLADWIMSKPTNWAARGPTWKQEFWRSVEQQIGFADAATQRAIIDQARKANLGRDVIRRMEATRKAGAGSHLTSMDDVELIAKGHATHQTRRLLYDLMEVGQFSDAARAAIPFAEAYKEIFVAWARIIRDRPQVIRRGQQAIEGARGAGWFWQDPGTGEEMFTYGGGHLVSRALLSGAGDSRLVQGALSTPGVGFAATLGLGVAGAFMDEQEAEFDLVGNVSGLNLVGSLVPGFGPAVTIPAAQLIPDRPQFDWLRDNILFPFGAPDVSEGVVESLLPAWADKLRTGWMKDPDTDRIYANSVFDVARALVASGEFSTDSPAEIERLLVTAKHRAKGLWFVRGAAQFIVPTGPQARFRVQDLDGDWWPFQVIATEFHRLQREHGEQEAVQEFLSTFGTDLISLVQSKSRQVVERPTTAVGDAWIQENRDLAVDYRTTIGLIAPDDPLGEFDYRAYQRSFDEGHREQLTAEQMLWLSNNLLGRFAYANAVTQIDALTSSESEARQARALTRAQLMDRFPGFGAHLGVSERPRVEQQIDELEKMAGDARLADNEAVQALTSYLRFRRQAQVMVDSTATRSTTFRSSGETAWIRQWLRQRAATLTEATPEFVPLWERVLSRELADDAVPEPGQLFNDGLATFGLAPGAAAATVAGAPG